MQKQRKKINFDMSTARTRMSQRTNEISLVVGKNRSSHTIAPNQQTSFHPEKHNQYPNIVESLSDQHERTPNNAIGNWGQQPSNNGVNHDDKDKNVVRNNNYENIINNNDNIINNNFRGHNNENNRYSGHPRSEPVQLSVRFHEARTSTGNVILDPSLVPGAKEGDIGELELLERKSKKLYFMFKEIPSNANQVAMNTLANSNTVNSSSGNNSSNSVSILSGPIQTLMDLKIRSHVLVKVKRKQAVEADVVEIYIKDIHLARGDMWNLSNLLVNSCLYKTQRLSFLQGSIRGTVNRIYRNGKKMFSSYVGSHTKIVFRSESARLIFFIQISSEMWHFEESGQQMFHKLVNSLFPKVFQRWKDMGTHHLITIVLFSSVDLSDSNSSSYQAGEKPSSREDYYRVVVDQVNILFWNEIMAALRLEFANFQRDIMLKVNADRSPSRPEEYLIKGRFLPSVKGNLLEAVNLGMSLVSDDFRDPDLRHTTNHFVIVTPGTGIFDTDYNMLIQTSKLMTTIDSTIDVICLSQPPLHVVPLFRYHDSQGKLKHCIPSWMDISFWSDASQAVYQWLPRCKIYELQMMGVMENELSAIIINELNLANGNYKSVIEAMDAHDEETFSSPYAKKTPSTNSRPNSDSSATSKYLQPHKANKTSYSGITSVGAVGFSDRHPPRMSRKMSAEFDNDKSPTVRKGFEPPDLVSAKASTPTTSTAMGVTTTSKSNVSAFSSLLTISKNESKKTSPNAFDFVKRIISSPLPLQPTPSGSKISATSSSIESNDDVPDLKSVSVSDLKKSYSNIDLRTAYKQERHAANSSPSLCNRDLNSQSTAFSNSSTFGSTNTLSSKTANQKWNKKSVPKINEEKNSILNSYWTNVENPSNAVTSELLGMVSYGRWKFVFPPNVKRRSVKWTSLSSPASLPIMTPVFPSVGDFNQNFTFHIYDVYLNQADINEGKDSASLMRKMISLRLTLGFQICVGDNVAKVENQRKPNGDANLLIQYLSVKNYHGSRIYLSLSNEIHRISCDYHGLINVQVYKRTNKPDDILSDGNKQKYIPYIRTRYSEEYHPVTIRGLQAEPRNYNWNQLDQRLAGYDENFDQATLRKAHKIKFVILPTKIPPNSFKLASEKLTPEEIRLEGIRSLITIINRARYKTPEEKKERKKTEITPEINFYTGNLFKYLSVASNELDSSEGKKHSLFQEVRFNQNVPFVKLALALQGEKGIEVVDRKWHLRTHSNCFLGMELVSWMIESFEDIDTREQAVEYGNKLMSEGLFRHVEQRHSFLDGHYFYQWAKEYSLENIQPQIPTEMKSPALHPTVPKKTVDEYGARIRSNSAVPSLKAVSNSGLLKSASANTSATTNSTPSDSPNVLAAETPTDLGSTLKHVLSNNTIGSAPSAQVSNDNTSTTTGNVTIPAERRRVVLSRKVLCDLDPNNVSWKPEHLTVHYDMVHNPEHCFHIRLEWLSSTTKLVDDTVNGWAKHCERFGLTLVETPWEELCTLPDRNPLHSTIDISLVLNPWLDEEFSGEDDDGELFGSGNILKENNYFYHMYLLEKTGFLLDNRTATYFKDDSFDVCYSWGKPTFKYAQYIHKTGAYIAELRENGDFFLAPNNAHVARVNLSIVQLQKTSGMNGAYLDSQGVMLDFREICKDENKLREIFREAKGMYEKSKDVETAIFENGN